MRPDLPVDHALPEIDQALAKAGQVVLVAEPGAGKTTRVPPHLAASLESGAGKRGGRVLVLEPRRIAARAAAARIAEEEGSELGKAVGYQVRGEKRWGRDSRVVVLTEGLLVRFLQNDPELDGVAAVVIDEFHERSRHADLALALLKELRASLRPDLQLVVMSATMDADSVSRYLGGAPIVNVPGRTFPVETTWLGDSRRAAGRPERADAFGARVADAVSEALESSDDPRDGVLAFLPGAGEIRAAEKKLRDRFSRSDLEIGVLYGALDLAKQQAVIRASKKRKVVLATNVAETSLTVEGIRTVVDSGYERRLVFDAGLGLDRLELHRIAKSSADQRRGRAGRQAPGRCFRIWSRSDEASLEEFTPPEARRVDPAESLLEVLAWGVSDPSHFDWYESPDPEALEVAGELLVGLGAAERRGAEWHVTALGRRLVSMPLPPRLARLFVEADAAGFRRDGALLAALLSERDPFQRGLARHTSGESDLWLRLEELHRLERTTGARRDAIETRQFQALFRRASQIERGVDSRSGPSDPRRPKDESIDWLTRALLAGWPDRVARRREARSEEALMVGGRGLRLERESCVKEAEFFVAVELAAGRRGSQSVSPVRLASAIELEDLKTLRPDEVTQERVLAFDPSGERVRCTIQTRYRDLVLDARHAGLDDPARAGEILEQALRSQPSRVLDKLEDPGFPSLRERIAILVEHCPELGFQALDETQVIDLLASWCVGRSRFSELRRAPVSDLVLGGLTRPQRLALDREVPSHLELRKGRRVAIRYEKGQDPTVAARVQHLFGCWSTPRLAQGKVALVFEILAPNQRPVQRTTDLESFWRNTYAQVRKDLRGRYPKHDWPSEPPPASS